MTPAVRWEAPPLGTSAVDAAILYRDGVAALVAGTPHADRLLAASVSCDPTFVLAQVGLSVSRYVATGLAYAPPAIAPTGRAERHHAEIVRVWLTGDHRRGVDLRREHLLEYPGDVLIVWLPALTASRQA